MEEVKKLYTALIGKGYTANDLGNEDVFAKKMQDEQNRRELYDYVSSRGDFKIGSYDNYEQRLRQKPQPVVDAYGMPMQPEVSTIEDAPKVEEKPQENLKSDLFKPQSTETPSLLNVGAKPKDYFAEAGAKAMEGIRQERQAREYQEIMKPLSGIEGSEQKKVLEERKKQIEAQLNQPDAVRNAAARTNMAKALENVDKELQVLNEQQKQWQEQYGSWTPSSARRFREQTMEQTWHDPYAVVPEEYKALATQKWGKEGSEDAYFSAWMNLSPEEREAFVKREHIKSFFNEETANKMQGIRERATTYAQNALSEPVVSVDPRHSASAMAARTVSNIGVQTTKALDKAEEIKQAYKNHELDENFFAGAYKGMKDGLTDIDNWTGLYMVGEMSNLYDIADKMEKGEALSQTEEDFLDAQAYKLAVEAALADDLGWGYSSGNVTGASVPFMLQMLASPIGGASGKAIDKGFAAVGRRAIDKFGKGILKKLLTKAPVKKIAKGLVGTVGKGIGQTILFGSDRVAAGTMERHLGNEMVAERANEEFNAGVQAKAGEDLGTALFKAGVSASMENISEFAGGAFIDDFTKMVGKKISKEFMDAMGGSVGRRMANAAARQNANKVFRAIANNKWGQHAVNLSKSVQSGMEWDGLLNEYLEEVLNNASNVMIGDMSMEDFTSLEKNAETLLGLAWTSGFFMANNAASRVGGYARGNIALKRTDRAARQIFTGDMQEKWDAYTQALSQADGYEEVEQLYKGLMADISKNQDKEAAKAQMSEATAYMANYVKMMGMNAATEEADEEEQKTPAQKEMETAQGEGIAAQGTEEELDVVEEMDESYNQLAGHLGETNVEDWLFQYGETADKRLEAIRGSELDEQTKAMAEAYLTSAQRYEGLLLANQEEVDAIVEEAAKEFDANVNQELGSVIQVLTTQGKTAYVIQGNPNERENIRLRYEDGTTEPVSHVVIEKVLSQADAQTMRSDMIEGVRKSAVAEVVKRMQGVVPNATQMQMPVGHNVVVDGQAGVVAGVNADGTMQIQMQGGNVVNAAPQQVMDAQAYNTIMERKARARESARVSVPVREEVATPVAEEAAAAEAVAEEAIAAEEELTEAQKLLQEYMDESVSLEDRQAIVENNVAQAKQAAVEAQAEVDAMTESKPKATDYTSIAEFKQAQEEWKAQMQEKQQVLDLARQQEATWSEVQKGMVQPVETAAEQASAEAVPTAAQVTEVQRAEAKNHNSKHDIKALAKEIGVSAKRIQRVIDFANQVGVKLNFANVTRTEGNAGAFTNADNMASKREITLSKYQLAKGMAIEWVMGHELTHQIKADGNAANWEAYKQAIINALGQDAFDKRVKEQSKVYREAGAYRDMSANEFVETMQEEVCADAAGDMLLNPDNMNKVMGVPQSLASRIWSALKDMVTFSTPTKIKQAVDAWQQLAEGKELTGEAADREKHSIVSDKAGEELEETASATRYSIVVDPQLIAELEASPKRKGYRNVVQREDGLFEAPMGNSLRGNGITVENTPFAMGQWEQSEEHPELVYGDNKITLVKPDGKTVADVNYNPYIHNRLNTLNAQFKQAWERPDLVYIETEVPETDLEGGYMAEHAHLSTGVHQWSNGALMLSRYDKPVRIVPWDEVAIPWIEKYKKSGVHFDIVPPALRPILAAAGVEIKEPHNGMGENCIKAYEEWKAEQEIANDKKFSKSPLDMSEEEKYQRGEMLRNAPAVDVQSNTIVATPELSARRVAEQWWEENVPEAMIYDTEVGEVEINKNSIESSLAHRYGQKKLDAITSLVEGFENAVYLGTLPDSRERGVVDHYFAYPINYDGKRNYVFCRAMQDANKNRLYVHEVFVEDKITKGNTLQTAASKPHGGISLYRDILANVLSASKDTQSVSAEQTDKKEISEKSAESNVEVTNEGVMHSISPIEGYTYSEVIDMVQNDVENILSEEGIDNVEAVEFWAHGSRMRGNAKEDSDLDVVMFYKGNEKEDSLFNLINEHELAIDGIKVDVNPIRISNEQDIARYKEKSARYDQEMRFSLSAEEQDIVDAAKADGTYMKTPNGKPTNLNEKQWAQVRTKAFKEWFGDWENDPENASKVVDENGEPMVVYHYTPNEFTEFDTEKIGSSTDVGALGRGFYFSPSDKFTLYGDKKMALFVNAKNPMLLNDSNAFEAKEPFFKADYKWDNESAQAFADDVQAKGYDAVYYENRGMDEIVAFRPTQIKSATDNVGTFDAENADIRYSMPGHSVASRIYGHPFTGAWQKFLQRAPKGVLKPGYGIIDESRLPEFADWYRMLVPEAEEYKEFVSLFLEDATATEKKHIQSVMDRVDKIVDDYRRLAEGDNSVLSLENNARFSITPDILAANERFNEELDEFKAKTHKGLLHLGKPGAILRTIGVDADEMTISPTILHQHLKEHGLTVDDIKGLALSVQSPILAYRHGLKYPNLVIVTEMDVKGGKLSVSLELDGDGHIVAISNIKSVHSKDAIKEVERLMDMGAESLHDNLKWVEKEEVSDWLLRLPYEDERTKDNPKLSSVANVLLSFQNPPIIGDESSQNVENAKSGEQKYSLPGRPATPKRNEGESIMEYAQRVANATEAQKAWDVANKTAMDIDRQIKNSEEYRDILAQKEPQTIEEAASVALAGGKLLWNDHVDGTKVSKGAKSMMGWGEGERQRFFAMFASKENGGVSVEQMGEAVMDICSQYNIPVDETDAMAGTNAVLEVLQSAQRPSDITGYIEHNRIEQVRRMIEEEQELLASERNKAYMDMYGMTYDDFVEIASTIDAEDEQERSDDKNVIAWLYGQSQRQQERITNAQTELEQLKMNGVPKTQYDAAYRALEQMKAKAKQIQAKLDEVTRKLSAAKGQATRQKKANMRYKEKKGQWKQVYKELRQAINGKNIRSIDKSTLNEIMRAVGSADLSGMARLFGEAGMIEDIILGVNMRAAQDRIDKLLATKTTALNDKGIATGKSVDASVQAILANVRKTLEGILHHDIENQIHDLRSQNWHIRHNAVGNLSQEQQEQVDANKAKIEELKAELSRELATSTANTEQAVNEQIENLTEQIDKGLRTEEESAELMTTLALKRQMVAIHTSYQDTATVEALLRRKQSELRTNWVALHDGNTPQDKREEYRQKRKALQEQIAGLEAQVREGRQATLDAMQSFAKSLEETITTGRANLKSKVQEQLQRRKEFVAKAIHDVNASGKQMQSVNEADKQENDKLPWYKRMFSPALRTFDYMLQKIATRTYGKDSWLYRQFMLGENGVMAAHDEYLRGMQTAARTLEDKAKEIFGKSYQDVMADSNRKKDIGIEILRDAEDYEPSYIPLKLTKGQATYIYMLWRMRDGYSKLATQGFTEEIMQRIEEYIGPDYIQWADWMQMEYLPMMRKKYNARYRQIYDTNMAAIDNYVPIRIHGQAIRKEVDLTDATASMPGMQKKNGALIQRTVNVNPIDISNNIFELIGQHIDEMEEFYAYAPVRRDLQYILSSPAFRNILNANEPGTFQSLLEAARIATKTNQQPESAALKAFNDIMNKMQKGLVSGNIAYRNMTAIKQVLSAPAFIGYSQSPEYLGILAKNMLGGYLRNLPTMAFSLILGIGHWAQKMTVEETAKGMPYIDKFLGESFRWCMREFPDFRERVTRGSAGDIRLEEKGFSELLDKYTEIGMSANVFIDAVTVSVGLKSIYDYEMKKAEKRIQKMAIEMQMDEQWEEEEMRKASNAAKIQATLFANQTQQSSNPALLSPMQVSKNFMERSLTLYKNSSLGLMRAGIGGMRNLLRYMKGKKAKRRMTEEYTRMFMQEGFAENEAKKRAISYINSEARKGAFVALLEGYAMNVIWNLGSKGLLGFMTGGGDDDNKERTIGEWVWDGIKHVVKNTFGSAMPFVDDALEGRLPAIGLTTSEAEKAWKDIKKQLDKNGISLAFALTGMRYAAKFGGVDMQVWANTMDGYYRLFSETGNSDDNILALMLILNSPHSNRIAVARELYKGKSEEEFQRAMELAGRYNQPVWTFGREITDKVESDMAKWYLSDNATDEEKQRMSYIEEMEDRIDNLETVEDALEMFDEVSDTELRKKISSKIDQLSKPEDTFAEKVDRKKKNALAEDDADMEGYTYTKMADSQDLLEEKRMRAEIDMLRPIVEQQKELFEEYGSKSDVYTRFMAEHGAEIRRYNTLKAYSRAIQTRKRRMDEEGADVQALYEEIKGLYNDAKNM